MTSFSITPLEGRDLAFLRAMLYEAAVWRSAVDRPPLEVALSSPDLSVYVRDWGRPGDAGLIARADRCRAGAVWVRRFNTHEHGVAPLTTTEGAVTMVRNLA